LFCPNLVAFFFEAQGNLQTWTLTLTILLLTDNGGCSPALAVGLSGIFFPTNAHVMPLR
jgi:hypothetical protein